MTQPHQPFRLILASASARRRSLLAEAGYRFEVVRPGLDEPPRAPRGLSPSAQAQAWAYFKARSVAADHPDAVVLGADTIVAADDGAVLGKADDEAGARRMLQRLSGTRHSVITGVAAIALGGMRMIRCESTAVTMRAMSPREIDDYVASGEWRDKAGAYAIQETADRFVERVDGSFSNVVGLPMELVGRMLSAVARRLPAGCEA